ncbi:MAG: type IV toxin-antitoxin system AbiEi family antitoxin [Bdellovibrionales bacterium]|nr:type IV toxin-antitoxin system AbiEi family antitoxin [Bdellovibrionales bacterium]
MSKLNKLITSWSPGQIHTTSYLTDQGYSSALLAQYRKNNWIYSVGKGAVARVGDSLDWRGGLVALQQELGLDVHLAAKSALKLYGVSHFARKNEVEFLFGSPGTRLPAWFQEAKWGTTVKFVTTNLFKTSLGLLRKSYDHFKVLSSCRERALFEQLYLVPKHASFSESAHLFEGLHTLRSEIIETLLRECQSIKTKRLFMVVAEHLNYPWVSKLDLADIDFGKGNRVIDEGGKTHPKYNITVNDPFLF